MMMHDNEQSRFNPVTRKNEIIRQESLSGERALFRGENLEIYDTIFHDGESPLKESINVKINGCEFQWKYPLWYSSNVEVNNSVWQEMARSGVWYTHQIAVTDSMIWAPKNFRRCRGINLKNVSFAEAKETLWMCQDIKLDRVVVKGDYFGMNSENIEADHLDIYGNYAFDGAKRVTIRNSKLISKDCFWNCEDVTVYDSYISGEYLGWNTKNMTLVRCTILSDQGLDYIDGLTMEDCKLLNTRLAFENSTDMDVQVTSRIDSILNPGSGVIHAVAIGEQIIEPDNCDTSLFDIELDEAAAE